MKTEVNFEEYVARMENITDKVTVLDYAPHGGRVLDYGCGSGPLAQQFTPETYVGYDIAPAMVERARKENPGYSFTSELAFTEDEKFAAVLFSSLLHEVYSYNGYSYGEVIKTLAQARSLLKANGVIIIRDGITPSLGNTPLKLRLKKADDAKDFLEHLRETSPQTFAVAIEGEWLMGRRAAVVDFLNIYTWGWASVEREKHERVNFATFDQWRSLITSAGYRLQEVNIISQDDYFLHLEDLVELRGERWETKLFAMASLA